MSKKFIDIDGLKHYDSKLKAWVQNNVSIDGKDINVKNIVVQGDLTVNGITNTVNQETLTIKDNLIAVNGNGATLDAAGMAGIVANTGAEGCRLNSTSVDFVSLNLDALGITIKQAEDKTYKMYANSISDDVNIQNLIDCYYRQMIWAYSPWSNSEEELFYTTFDGDSHSSPTNGFTIIDGIWTTSGYRDNSPVLKIDTSTGEIIINEYKISSDRICDKEDVEFFTKYTTYSNDDFAIVIKAYAAPIYDKSDDSLKIGLGVYEKDESGNIKSFTFGDGQAQSVATRSDNLSSNYLPIFDERTNSFKNSRISYSNAYTKPDIGGIGSIKVSKDLEVSTDPVNYTKYKDGSITIVKGFEGKYIDYQATYKFSPDTEIDTGASITQTIATREWIPIDKQLETSFATKVRSGAQENVITAAESVAIGDANNIGVKRSLALGSANTISENDAVGGSNNLVTGASNIVVASTGATIGNSNIVGDIDGSKKVQVDPATGRLVLDSNGRPVVIGGGTPNQVNNSLVTGARQTVFNTRYSLINGEYNNVEDSDFSLISGQYNVVRGNGSLVSGNRNLLNHNNSALIGEQLTSTRDRQTIIGLRNQPNEDKDAIFIVAYDDEGSGKNIFTIDETNINAYKPIKASLANIDTITAQVANVSDLRTNLIRVYSQQEPLKIVGNLSVSAGIETGSGQSINSGYLALTHDATINRALYCPNIFKIRSTSAGNEKDTDVLNRGEIRNKYCEKSEVTDNVKLYQHTFECNILLTPQGTQTSLNLYFIASITSKTETKMIDITLSKREYFHELISILNSKYGAVVPTLGGTFTKNGKTGIIQCFDVMPAPLEYANDQLNIYGYYFDGTHISEKFEYFKEYDEDLYNSIFMIETVALID